MPHFKCVRCRTRLYSPARPADLVGDLCPGCGSLLEPVGELAEIVGFQSIEHRDSPADEGRPRRRKPIAHQVDDLFARSEEIRAKARLDARRSLDEGDSFGPRALAQAIALRIPPDLDDHRP
jgi:hypothetical protein